MKTEVALTLMAMCAFVSACDFGHASRMKRAQKELAQMVTDKQARYDALVDQATALPNHETNAALGFCFGDTREEVRFKLQKLNEQPQPEGMMRWKDEIVFGSINFKLSFEYTDDKLRQISLCGGAQNDTVSFDEDERISAIIKVLMNSYGAPSLDVYVDGRDTTKWLKGSKEVTLELQGPRSGRLVQITYRDLHAPTTDTLEQRIRQTSVPLDQF